MRTLSGVDGEYAVHNPAYIDHRKRGGGRIIYSSTNLIPHADDRQMVEEALEELEP